MLKLQYVFVLSMKEKRHRTQSVVFKWLGPRQQLSIQRQENQSHILLIIVFGHMMVLIQMKKDTCPHKREATTLINKAFTSALVNRY